MLRSLRCSTAASTAFRAAPPSFRPLSAPRRTFGAVAISMADSLRVNVGIRDGVGNTLMAKVGLTDRVSDALRLLNVANRTTGSQPNGRGWPPIKAEQLTIAPGASWAFQLEAEITGGILLPIMGLKMPGSDEPFLKEITDDFSFYFFSPSNLDGSAAGSPVVRRPSVPKKPIAFLFPGQGSQSVGMVQGVKHIPAVASMFATAKGILGYDLLELMATGPDEKLSQTVYTQPAMFVAGLAAVEKLRAEDPSLVDSCTAAAGLSLGEYTALTFAGALSFEDGLRLVKLRAEAMQEASTIGQQQGMLTVVGLEKAVLVRLCNEAKSAAGAGGVCQIANELFPKGYVCAGHQVAIKSLETKALAAKALQAKAPKTSGAFHTPLMEPASKLLQAALDATAVSFPEVVVYSNVTGKPYKSAADIKSSLSKQLTSPVLWEASVHQMKRDGITSYYETGPQKQLKSMMRRIDMSLFKVTTSVEV